MIPSLALLLLGFEGDCTEDGGKREKEGLNTWTRLPRAYTFMSGSVIDSISIAVQASGRVIVTLSGHRSGDVLDMAEVYESCRERTVDAQ